MQNCNQQSVNKIPNPIPWIVPVFSNSQYIFNKIIDIPQGLTIKLAQSVVG